MLTPAQKAARITAFEQAHAFIDEAVANGGLSAQLMRSFPKGVCRNCDRVDLEVRKGQAFAS